MHELEDGRARDAVAAASALGEVSAAVVQLGEASIAGNTRRAYQGDLRSFVAWCAAAGRPHLPASPETVAEYLADRAGLLNTAGGWRYAPSTLARALAAINAAHAEQNLPLPGHSALVTRTLQGIRRDRQRPTRQADPLMLSDIQAVLDRIDVTTWPAGAAGVRDRLLLLLGWAGAFRRSELTDLRVEDVVRHREDGLHVRVRRSKTDQVGKGLIKAVPYGREPLTCGPCAWVRWLRILAAGEEGRSAVMRVLFTDDPTVHVCRSTLPALRGVTPLLRRMHKSGLPTENPLAAQSVNLIVKRRVTAVGFDPARYSAHSLRAGFVTEALRQGATTHAVMRQTGHRSAATVETYARERDPLTGNAVTALGL
ncbi:MULTISPECIES: site-specific integrase [unclassified Rathayibacter]|uniref:site-specific integrase n=1 Tax=unclassified Rathayibacter TaxID=2609250 RepID=UPI001046BAD5|nr:MULTISPECIES: site-specific integrase [unclassified Rathayibacter]TCL79404.1 site-specific recombinase XerD [Rathayibacter sp. PhB192]TCM25327.1 site-specific recombinase XerD [Rathayibacter sp. PhB179]